VVLRWYAHRKIVPLAVFEVEVSRVKSDAVLRIKLDVDQFGSSEDLKLRRYSTPFVNVG